MGMKRVIQLSAIASIMVFVSSCMSNRAPSGDLKVGGRTINYVSPSEVGGPDGGPITRLFGGTCIFGGSGENATITTLAPIALNFAVDSLGKLLTRAGEEQAVAVYAAMRSRDTSGDKPNVTAGGTAIGGGQQSARQSDSVGCIQFVHGEFAGTADEAVTPDWLTAAAKKASISAETLVESLEAKGINLSEAPAFFMEAKIIRAEGGLYALRPQVLFYERSIDTGVPSDGRGLFFEFGINHGASSLTAEKASKGILAIGKMKPGGGVLYFDDKDPRVPVMLWTSAPAGNPTADQARNIEARLIEVEDARPVLAAFGELLSGASGDQLAESLRKDLFPTSDEEAAEVTARITALGQYQTALAGYRSALNARDTALKEATGTPSFDVVVAEQDAAVQAAKLAVVLAAQQAGVTPPTL